MSVFAHECVGEERIYPRVVPSVEPRVDAGFLNGLPPYILRQVLSLKPKLMDLTRLAFQQAPRDPSVSPILRLQAHPLGFYVSSMNLNSGP